MVAAGLWVGAPALALTIYTDVVTANWSYTGIQESSSYGDPEPLFDQPLGSGDDLVFFPPNFAATSTGGGLDATGSQLQLQIEGNLPSNVISAVNITEFGDVVLAGFLGTGATGAFASMAGFITVLETTSGPISPVVIPFLGIFTPGDTFTFPANPGTTIWSATASIDVAGVVPNATKVQVSFDNDLFAASEATTSSKIQKKVVDGPAVIIEVIPEPATLTLLGLALAGLGSFRRGSRH